MKHLEGSVWGREVKNSLFIILLGYWLGLVGCNSSARKETKQVVEKKDTIKVIVHPEDIVTKDNPKKINYVYKILDTIVGRDTIKFVLYRDSMIRCSINNLSDTFNSSGRLQHWDSSFGDYGLIIEPGKKKLKSLILNDSLLIVPISFGYSTWDGGVALYMLNRTKHSLRFASSDKNNPILTGSSCPYVDLKNNEIMSYFYRPVYDNADAGINDLDHPRYLVYRYKIISCQTALRHCHNHFIQTDEVAASSPELEKIDMFGAEDSVERIFYTWLAHHEDWGRDKYSYTIYQKVVILDTIAGKDTIRVYYDNRGLIVATLNQASDTLDWGGKWKGYEWWRGKENNKIVVPGGENPVSFILNDTLLILSLCDTYRYASLFAIRRYHDSLSFMSDELSTTTSYLYVDLKNNSIIEQAGRLEDDIRDNTRDAYSQTIPFTVNKYKINHDAFFQINSIKLSTKELNDIDDPDSYRGSEMFYNIVVH